MLKRFSILMVLCIGASLFIVGIWNVAAQTSAWNGFVYLPITQHEGQPNSGGGGDSLTLTTTAVSPTIDHFATFTFTAGLNEQFRCSLNDAPFALCTSPITVMDLALGNHQFTVQSLNDSGMLLDTQSVSWEIASIFELPPAGLLTNDGTPPDPDPNGGAFRVKCDFSHANYDDPIVFPNQPGRAHLHMYFGNWQTTATSTITSMVTSGRSTCQGGILNRSSYWAPTVLAPVYDDANNPVIDENGDHAHEVVLPLDGGFAPDIYYKNPVSDNSVIQPMPHGLRMISGNGAATSPQSYNVIRWACESWTITSADDFTPGIPRCDIGDVVELSIAFPPCWDGENLYAADQSHMSQPEAIQVNGNWMLQCPTSHPVTLPVVSYNFAFPVTAENAPFGDSRYWRVSSDSYDVTDETPGGYSVHGDWFMAWNPEAMETFIVHCLQAGLDCKNGELGNGWRMTSKAPGTGEIPPVINYGRGNHHPFDQWETADALFCAVSKTDVQGS